MGSWLGKLTGSIKKANETRKAPKGLKYLAKSQRQVFLIKDDSEIRKKLIKNSTNPKAKYPSFNGKVLKKAETGPEIKQNMKEYETWQTLKESKFYRKVLAKTFLCTSDGKYLVMERVKPVEKYSRESKNFADKIQDKVLDDLDVSHGNVDVHGSAIGKKKGQFKIYDYPWVSV